MNERQHLETEVATINTKFVEIETQFRNLGANNLREIVLTKESFEALEKKFTRS
jgi:hypothetical protein